MNTSQPNPVPNSHGPEVSGHAPGSADSSQPTASLASADALNPAINVQPPSAAQPMDIAHSPEASPATVGGAVQQPPSRRRSLRPKIRHLHMPKNVRTFESMRYRNYRLVWSASAAFSGGFWLQQVVIGWLTFDLTGSALLTTLAMGLDAFPLLFLGPMGGLLVDTLDRRKLLATMFAYQSVVTALFSVLIFTGQVATWHIFGFILMMGMGWVILDPVRMSIIPNTVPKRNLVNAFALNSLGFSTTRLLVPALGGVVLALSGPGYALMMEASLQLVAFSFALMLRLPDRETTTLKLASAISNLKEGVCYVKGQPTIQGVMLMSVLLPFLVFPFSQGLIPVYAAEVFDVGEVGLGLLMSSIGAGAVVGTLVLASLGDVKYKGRLTISGIVVIAVSMALLSQNRFLPLVFLNLMALSVGTMVFFSMANTIIQSIIPDKFRGRVSSLYALSFGTMPLGSLLAGTLASQFGAPTATFIGSGILLTLFALLMLRFRFLWHFTGEDDEPLS